MASEPLVDRLREAINSRDPDRVAACFTDDYRCEMPLHPSRGFVGAEQVRRNYTQIFAAVPDLHADVLRQARAGEEIWSEWEMRGSGPGGAPTLLRGVVVCGGEEQIAWSRFYLDPVTDAGPGAAVPDTGAPAGRDRGPGVSR